MIGFVTIGQAPRNDITGSMLDDVISHRIIQTGALDGLSAPEIAALAPGSDDNVLVTRLADGTEVIVGKRQITPLVQAAIIRAVDAGADMVCILCTGAFNGLKTSVPLVFPDLVVKGVADALLPEGMIGVIMPHDGQRDFMVHKWSNEQRVVVTGVASPYTAAKELAGEARRLCADGAQLLVMDCMGFTRDMERTVRKNVDGIPVVLSNGVVGSVIAEVWGLDRARENTLAI